MNSRSRWQPSGNAPTTIASLRQIDYGRYSALDGARGIAATIVLLLHCISWFDPIVGSLADILYRAVLALGHPAAMFFFVLSGFVLSLRFLRANSVPYARFQLGRLLRLYPCFLVAMILAVVIMLSTNDFPGRENAGVFSDAWVTELTLVSFARQLLLVGLTPADIDLNGPVWTLIYELRAGLFIPLFCWGLKRFHLAYSIGAVAVLVLMSWTGLVWLGMPNPPFTGLSVLGSLFVTLHYLCPFYIGCIVSRLCHQRIDTLAWCVDNPVNTGIAAVVCLTVGTVLHSDIMSSLFGGFAVLAIVQSSVLQQALSVPPVTFLGRISCPLYLVHFPILLGILRVTAGAITTAQFFTFAVVISGAVAIIVHHLLEVPSIGWARRVS